MIRLEPEVRAVLTEAARRIGGDLEKMGNEAMQALLHDAGSGLALPLNQAPMVRADAALRHFVPSGEGVPILSVSEKGVPSITESTDPRRTAAAIYRESAPAVGFLHDGDKFLGTGFAVKDGMIATAKHNLNRAGILVTRPLFTVPGKEAIPLNLVAMSNDGSAILRASKPPSYLPYLEPDEPASKASYMIGYPGIKTPVISEGTRLVGLSQRYPHILPGGREVENTVLKYLTDHPTTDGLRGAPFLTTDGKYYGISTGIVPSTMAHGPIASSVESLRDGFAPSPHFDPRKLEGKYATAFMNFDSGTESHSVSYSYHDYPSTK